MGFFANYTDKNWVKLYNGLLLCCFDLEKAPLRMREENGEQWVSSCWNCCSCLAKQALGVLLYKVIFKGYVRGMGLQMWH